MKGWPGACSYLRATEGETREASSEVRVNIQCAEIRGQIQCLGIVEQRHGERRKNSRTRTSSCMCLGGVRCSRRQKPPPEESVHLRRGQKDRDREIRNLKSAHRREEATRIAKMTKRYGSPSLHFIVERALRARARSGLSFIDLSLRAISYLLSSKQYTYEICLYSRISEIVSDH